MIPLRPTTRRVWISSGLVVIVAVAGLTWLAWTWRHPGVFTETSGGVGVSARDHPIGRTMWFGMTDEGRPGPVTVEIDIDEVRAAVVVNTADAEIEFLLCTLDPEAGGSIGSVSGDDLAEFCSSLEPVSGATVALNAGPSEQVIMGLTPGRPGVVEVAGMEISYRHGWQSGTQTTGEHIRLRSR